MVNKRSRFTNQSLDDLLLVLSNKLPLKNFNPDIDLWWSAKRRRRSQKERKQYKPRGTVCGGQPSTSTQAQESESELDMLDHWNEIMNSEDENDSDSIADWEFFNCDTHILNTAIYQSCFLSDQPEYDIVQSKQGVLGHLTMQPNKIIRPLFNWQIIRVTDVVGTRNKKDYCVDKLLSC